MRKSSARIAVLLLGAMLAFTACNPFSPDDKAIVSEIQAKLFQDSVLKTRDIRVTANQGMVILTGTVNTDLERSAAERLAAQVSGVKQVQNQLSVTGESAAQAEQAPAAEPAPAEQPTPIAEAPARPAERARARRTAASREGRRPMTAHSAAAGSPQEQPAPSEGRAPAKASAPVEAATPAPPPPPKPVRVTIPEGTVITVQMVDSVDSSRDRGGQDFTATVFAPVVVGERVVIPRGADARVRLVSATSAGRMTGTPELALELSGVTIAGNNYDTESTTYRQKGPSRTRRTEETVGGGAILGGLIGAIAGHGKGAAIGSVIGAGAGTAAEAGTKAAPVRVASETKIDFTLRSPISVTLPPSGSSE